MNGTESGPWRPPGPALLFCPADRPDRYGKALAVADAVVLDLEDAVAPEARPTAREAIRAADCDRARTVVRVNATGTDDHAADLDAVRAGAFRCVMLAKTESAEHVTGLHEATGAAVLALVETPLGVVRAAEIAAAAGCAGMMWGAEDLVAAMGGTTSRFTELEGDGPRIPGEYRDVPRHARSAVALAAAAFGRWAVDSVHLDIADVQGLRAEVRDAAALGYAATACIHPGQVEVIRSAYTPAEHETRWAHRVLDAASRAGGVFRLDGRMVDGPVLRQAEQLVRRSHATTPGQGS